MIPNVKLDKFLNSTMLTTSIFIASGCYKTYKDYKLSTPEYKDKFLVKDCVILSGAALGMLANQGLSSKISKPKILKNIVDKISTKIQNSSVHKKIEKPLNYTKEITKEIILGLTTTASGILGALGTDYLLSKTSFEEPNEIINKNSKSNTELKIEELENHFGEKLEKYTDEDTVDVFYSSITDMPKFKFLGAGMVGVDAIDITQNKKFDEKLKHTTGYLINDTLVPLLFLSSSSALTQNMKAKHRIPIIFASLFGGTLATHKIFDKYAKKEVEKV